MLADASLFGGPDAVAWKQAVDVFAAVVLCGIIGLEREVRRKSAGLRTHSTVGLAAAVIMIVSKFGFGDVIGPGVELDPSRVAAQIVTGIGFVGAGLIFVRRDAVRGLTTAASVWLSAAIGMACGAHLIPLAAIGTFAYLFLSVVLYAVERRLPQSQAGVMLVQIAYRPGRGALREVVRRCVARDFVIVELATDSPAELDGDAGATAAGAQAAPAAVEQVEGRQAVEHARPGVGHHGQADRADRPAHDDRLVHVVIGLRGSASPSDLLSDLVSVAGVVSVAGEGTDEPE